MQVFAGDADGLCIQIDFDEPGLNNRIGMSFGAADNCLNAGEKLALVKRFGQIVVCTVTQPLDFFIRFIEAGQIRTGVVILALRRLFKTS